MRLLTAGSLVRAQLEEPKAHQKVCFFVCKKICEPTTLWWNRKGKVCDCRRRRKKGADFCAGAGEMGATANRATKAPNRMVRAQLEEPKAHQKVCFFVLQKKM